MTYIPEALRQFVVERAKGCCEYCRIHQDDVFVAHHIDHIIAEKHHGQTTEENLCLSCARCNFYKGSDIASIDIESTELTPLFHPRLHNWHEHFQLDGIHILPVTPIGRVTEYMLALNSTEQLAHRAALPEGRYPCEG